MKKIKKAIEEWRQKHKGNVCFLGCFAAFDKKCNIIDDRIFCYGDSATLKEEFIALFEEIKKIQREEEKEIKNGKKY